MVIEGWALYALLCAPVAQLLMTIVCVKFVKKAARVQLSSIPLLVTTLEDAKFVAAGGSSGYTMYGVQYPKDPPGEEYEKDLPVESELDKDGIRVVNLDDHDLALLEAEGHSDLDPVTRAAVFRDVRNKGRPARGVQEAEE